MKDLIIIRGGGDLATGTIYKLKKSGFPVLILETQYPSAIRRNVAFCEAVYQSTQTVEDMTCYLAASLSQAEEYLADGKLTVLVDPAGDAIRRLKPLAVVDAILAKQNLGTDRSMAPITIALGPGFTAGVDVDAVVETKRGHHLGRVLWTGCAAPNTGIPGIIGGYGKERVMHSPAKGILRNVHKITDTVSRGEAIAVVETDEGTVPVEATLDGILRGLIRDGYPVTVGFKIADIDPRKEEYNNCFTISDKSRCIAGGVLEALLQRKGELGL
jgi:xanthine dehydrogenase accessory factor